MALNIGTPAVEAARELRGSPQFDTIMESLRKLTVDNMNRALESAPEHRADQVGYARGLRDVLVALESATTGIPVNQVKKPGMEKR